MQRSRKFFTLKTTRSAWRHAILLALLLTAGIPFASVKARGEHAQFAVYLGSAGTGYVNVTAYIVEDQYGNVWVDGYDNEPDFEIVLSVNDGQVLDPYGNQKGIFSGTPPV